MQLLPNKINENTNFDDYVEKEKKLNWVDLPMFSGKDDRKKEKNKTKTAEADPQSLDEALLAIPKVLYATRANDGRGVVLSLDKTISNNAPINISSLDKKLLKPDNYVLPKILKSRKDSRSYKELNWLESLKISGYCRYEGRLNPTSKSDAPLPLAESLLVEKEGVTYKHAVTLIHMPAKVSKEIFEWQKKNIDPNDVYNDPTDMSKGLENEFHTTILYGLKKEDVSKVKKLVKGFGEIKVELGDIMLFDNKDNDRPYEVLNVNVISEDLNRLHLLLKDNVENKNTWPDYKPHVCIGYLKKGAGKKYLSKESPFKDKELVFDHFIFSISISDEKKEKTKIKLVD